VNRGGSWNNNPRNVRASNRNNDTPDNRNSNIGLRVAVRPDGGTRRVYGRGGRPTGRPDACPAPARRNRAQPDKESTAPASGRQLMWREGGGGRFPKSLFGM